MDEIGEAFTLKTMGDMIVIFFFNCMPDTQVARHTKHEGHFKVLATVNYFFAGAVATNSLG